MVATTDRMKLLNTPDKIVEAAEKVYAEQYQAQLERESPGKFVAIDVITGKAYVGDFPELALGAAREDAPHGVFHLIRIGSPGAYKVSYSNATGDAGWSRVFRSGR